MAKTPKTSKIRKAVNKVKNFLNTAEIIVPLNGMRKVAAAKKAKTTTPLKKKRKSKVLPGNRANGLAAQLKRKRDKKKKK